MAVTFKVVSKNTGGISGNNQPKYYPVPTDLKTIDLRGISQIISERSSLETIDIYRIGMWISSIIPELLQKGYNVKLDELGTFSLSLSANGMDKPEKVTDREIKKVSINFRTSTYLKEKLPKTQFKKLS